MDPTIDLHAFYSSSTVAYEICALLLVSPGTHGITIIIIIIIITTIIIVVV